MDKKNLERIGIFCMIFIFISILFLGISKIRTNIKSSIQKSPEYIMAKSYNQITSADEVVANTQNSVKFSAFFAKDLNGDGYAEKILGSCNRIGNTDTLYIELNVGDSGRLDNGVIQINGNNFTYKTNIIKDDAFFKNNYITNNLRTIELKDGISGAETRVEGQIYAKISGKYNYSETNSITLTGTWVPDDSNADSVEISKTINLDIDWYGETTSTMYAPSSTLYMNQLNNTIDKAIELNFEMQETTKELLPEECQVQLQIPQMFGNYPTKVECVNTNVTSEYNEETHIFTINKATSAYNTSFAVKLTYPQESYDQVYNGYVLSVPIDGYYQCYNNENVELNLSTTSHASAPKAITFYKTNEVDADYEFKINVADTYMVPVPTKVQAISKEKLIESYNNENEENMTYMVRWNVRKTTKETTNPLGIIMKETDEDTTYGDTWDGINMTGYIKNTGIYFYDSDFLTENSYVAVYNNETNELIKDFSYNEVKAYNSKTNSYKFSQPVKHIRVETTEVLPESDAYLEVCSIKEVDNELVRQSFTKAQIENTRTLQTNLKGLLTNNASSIGFDTCYLAIPKSYASINASEKSLSAAETNPINEVFTINVPSATEGGYTNWKNGEFLIAFENSNINETSPIAYMELNNIEITSDNNNVKILGYDLIKGKNFIKILTKNDDPTSNFKINVDTNILINPLATSSKLYARLYYYNEYKSIYHYEATDKYDLNENENTIEIVGLSTAQIDVAAANTFVSTETVTEYKGEEVTIAPNVAEIEKGTSSAQVNVLLKNNYQNHTVENVKVLGRLPVEGNVNTSGKALGSQFTAPIMEKITVPQEIRNYTNVYYSRKTNPTSDITDENNGWVEASDLTDLSYLKSYLIVINNTIINPGTSYTFSYKVEIPSDVETNKKTYASHIVTYDVNTDGGKLQSTIYANKVGMQVTNYFDAEIVKYKVGTDLPVQRAKYEITELNELEAGVETEEETIVINGTTYEIGKTKIITSTAEGKLNAEDLKLNQVYSFKEIQAPSAYELSNKIIVFKVIDNSQMSGNNQTPQFTLISTDNFDNNVTMAKNANGKYVLKTKVNDIPKFALNITKNGKTGDGNETAPLTGVMFTINGQQIITRNGTVTVSNLSLNTEYTLKETYAKGYYLMKDVKFKLVQNGNVISIESADPETTLPTEFANAQIINSEQTDLVQVNVELTNEKIETYKLKVKKVDAEDETKNLEGATFLLTRTDLQNAQYYTTDENGEIAIDGMYLYKEGKDITGEYTLKETTAPTGYVNVNEGIKFVVTKNMSNELIATVENRASLKTLKDISAENDTVTMTIENRPVFKITKVDEDDETILLPNAEFIIYKLDSEGEIEDFAKDTQGNYLGRKNSKNQYTLKTNANGRITASLPAGDYRAVEVGYPTGYEEKPYTEVFTISGTEKEDKHFLPSLNLDLKTGEDDHAVNTHSQTTNTLEIYKIEDLLDLSDAVKSGNSYSDTTVLLMNDLDFNDASSYRNATAVYTGANGTGTGDYNEDGTIEDIKTEMTTGKGFPSIGGTTAFEGIFDGQNHKIKDLFINDATTDNKGLFGIVNNAVMKNVTVTGNVTGKNTVGGLIGLANNKIYLYKAVNECTVSALDNVGGLIGNVKYDSNYAGGGVDLGIDLCQNKGEVSGNKQYSNIGGLVGYINATKTENLVIIENSSNNGNILNSYTGTKSDHTGGIVGFLNNSQKSVIKNCSNEGTVNGYYIGGIVGRVNQTDLLILNNLVNNGEISSIYMAGGILGDCDDVNEMNLIDLTNKNDISGSGSMVGGIIGYSMSSNGNLVKAIRICNYGNITTSSDYGVAGCIGQISNVSLYIKDSFNKGIVTVPGNEGPNGVGGIIGYMLPISCQIENCYNEADINGTGYSAGIVGHATDRNGNNYLQIRDCYNTGNVTCTYNSSGASVGGIVGYAYNKSTAIDSSYNTGNIKGCYCVGGIIGRKGVNTTGTVSNCYNTGRIDGGYCAAGIVGRSSGLVRDSYNLGYINAYYPSSSGLYMGGICGETGIVDNCSNYGNVFYNLYANSTIRIGGISGGGTVTNSTNYGKIETRGPGATYVGGIVGYGTATSCCNKEDINSNYLYHNNNDLYVGGIVGSGSVTTCYNTGNINMPYSGGSQYAYAGGLAGSSYGSIDNSYNTGNIFLENKNNSTLKCFAGGIRGNSSSSSISYCYNVGDVKNEFKYTTSYTSAGPIASYKTSPSNTYYPDTISVIGSNTSTEDAVTEEYMKSDEFYQLLRAQSDKWIHVEGQYPMLNVGAKNDSNELVELKVKNQKKKNQYQIVAEIVSDGYNSSKGFVSAGSNYINYPNQKIICETVNEGESNQNSINAYVTSSNYVIDRITVNEIPVDIGDFNQRKSGYTMPAGYFENVDKDYNIKIKFADIQDKGTLTIKKVDTENNPLKGAVFKIEQQLEEGSTETPFSTELETDANGQIFEPLSAGTYIVTELQAPDGYIITEEPKTVTITTGENQDVTFTNKQVPGVVVHYYLKGTTLPLKENRYIIGNVGDTYDLSNERIEEINGYSLITTGAYGIPENETGTYGEEKIDVYYYYSKAKKINVQVSKHWKMSGEITENYRTEIQLMKEVEGIETPALDENGNELKVTLRGNQEYTFKNLPKATEDGKAITYKAVETKIEKLEGINEETLEEVWVELDLNKFKVTYGE